MKKGILTIFILTVLIILSGCKDKKTTKDDYVDYADKTVTYEETIGIKTNKESLDDLAATYDATAKTLKVQPIEGLPDDFIMGADLSMVLKVEQSGGVYYNDEGKEQDVFEILKEHGINYLRVRLWNNPYDPLFGTPYGGGDNDIFTDIALAKRAARVGMKILLDFHYSDTWADPDSQDIPYEWQLLEGKELEDALYNYTKETIETFASEGVRPHMVQIGNEINNGMLWPYGRLNYNDQESYVRLAGLLKAGVKAVKDVSPKIQTAIHLAEGGSFDKFEFFFDKMTSLGVEFDIIGLSYYSFWHGPMTKLQDNMNRVSAKYNKPVVIMEYSYGFTDKSNEHTANIYHSGLEVQGGYGTSFQGQATYIRDVLNAVAEVPKNKGLGAFYWEPAWLPVRGAGWAEEGTKATWSNQALFSYSGKATPVLDVFNLVRTSSSFEPEILSVDTEIDVNINIAAKETLPKTVKAYTTLHSYSDIPVTWETHNINEPGDYVVKGTISVGGSSREITANVSAIENFVVNPGFETRGNSESEIIAPWKATQSTSGVVKFESKNPRNGTNNANVWWDVKYNFDLYQVIDNLENGDYQLTVYVKGDSNVAPDVKLYAQQFDSNNTIIESETMTVSSWTVWHEYTITFSITNNKVQIGVKGSGDAEDWLHIDDFTLIKF